MNSLWQFINILFPAQAGVIPKIHAIETVLLAVPRASGGDPLQLFADGGEGNCSPRKRG